MVGDEGLASSACGRSLASEGKGSDKWAMQMCARMGENAAPGNPAPPRTGRPSCLILPLCAGGCIVGAGGDGTRRRWQGVWSRLRGLALPGPGLVGRRLPPLERVSEGRKRGHARRGGGERRGTLGFPCLAGGAGLATARHPRAGSHPMRIPWSPPPNPSLTPVNRCADTLLLNMYRWICSPASRLYDPALKQVGLRQGGSCA